MNQFILFFVKWVLSHKSTNRAFIYENVTKLLQKESFILLLKYIFVL